MVRFAWTREEMILAADVADDLDWKGVNSQNSRVRELSALLRRANFHPPEMRDENFRSPGSVGMKINNLNAWRPKPDQRGLRTSKSEWPVVESFLVDRFSMKEIAAEIRRGIQADGSSAEAASEALAETFIKTDPEQAQAAKEGGLRAVVSYRRERDSKLRDVKIASRIAKGAPISCEVCGFNFGQAYGSRGEGYIEVHHVTPLHVSGVVETSLEDLVLLCANCHRMIHRSGWITTEKLRQMLR